MFILGFILKLIGKILLISVWLAVGILWVCVASIMGIYSVVQGIAWVLIEIMFVGILIWMRDQPLWFVFLAVLQCIFTGILFVGVFVQGILEDILDGIGSMILYGC